MDHHLGESCPVGVVDPHSLTVLVTSPPNTSQLVPGIISEILTTAAIVVALIRWRTGWKQTDWMIKKCAM
jgi:hypothetical protein